jgi:hypothetical protein
VSRISEWLDTRRPAPPPQLAARLRELTADQAFETENDLSDKLIAISADLLKHIGDDRSAATDLLAADALITYAMESAAESCVDIEAIAIDASMRIAAIASIGGKV